MATAGSEALAVNCWEAGDPTDLGRCDPGRFVSEAGEASLISLGIAHGTPLVLPSRHEVEERLSKTIGFWREWAGRRRYGGRWREAVVRSALALKLLIYSPRARSPPRRPPRCPRRSAASATGTTATPGSGTPRRRSMPSCDLGADRGRGVLLVADARLPAHASQAADPLPAQRRAAVPGRRASTGGVPRLAAGANRQRGRQAGAAGRLRPPATDRLALLSRRRTAGRRCRRPAGGHRRSDLRALEAAGLRDLGGSQRPGSFHRVEDDVLARPGAGGRLANRGRIPDEGAGRWRREAEEIRAFVSERCWSEEHQAYMRFPGAEETDAGLLLPSFSATTTAPTASGY